MTLRNRRRILSVCSVLLLLAGAVLWFKAALQGGPLLIPRSRRICDVTNGGQSPCMWISNHAAILMPYHPGEDYFDFALLNADTGVQVPLAALNRKYDPLLRTLSTTAAYTFGSGTRFVEHHPPRCAVSQDGRWLLIAGDEAVATTLDGSSEVRWRNLDARMVRNDLVWLDDNRRWLELGHVSSWRPGMKVINVLAEIPQVIAHDRDHPDAANTVPLAHDVLTVPVSARLGRTQVRQNGSGQIVRMSWLIPANPTTGMAPMPDSVTVTDQSVAPATGSVQQTTVRLPIRGQVFEAAVSPDGTKIAWLILYDSSPPAALDWIYRIAPFLRAPYQTGIGLWVSDRDGSNMREAGHLAGRQVQGVQGINGLQWLPDGKQLSYLYRDGVYTISVL